MYNKYYINKLTLIIASAYILVGCDLKKDSYTETYRFVNQSDYHIKISSHNIGKIELSSQSVYSEVVNYDNTTQNVIDFIFEDNVKLTFSDTVVRLFTLNTTPGHTYFFANAVQSSPMVVDHIFTNEDFEIAKEITHQNNYIASLFESITTK